jgi:hypothetical protein
MCPNGNKSKNAVIPTENKYQIGPSEAGKALFLLAK